MNEFTVGDVVALQSGGAEMTVVEIRSDGVVKTIWTDSDGRLQETAAQGVCFFAVQK